MRRLLPVNDYFRPSEEIGQRIISRVSDVVELVGMIEDWIDRLVGTQRRILGSVASSATIDDGPIFVDATATVEPGAYITGPAYIGAGVVVRHCAYLRQGCILLEGSLAGHTTEVKNSLLLAGAKAPHFAYVGDSVLGEQVNLGAGTKLSNLKVAPGTIRIPHGSQTLIETGRRKFGAILGDGVATGCNAVLNPGTIVGPNAIIYAGVVLDPGVYTRETIIKLRQKQDSAVRR
jgi:NDP-sugar pyrophosphorylase family protein